MAWLLWSSRKRVMERGGETGRETMMESEREGERGVRGKINLSEYVVRSACWVLGVEFVMCECECVCVCTVCRSV